MEEEKEEVLTVKDLIHLLKQCPRDAEVFTEGCDCVGEAKEVEYCKNDNSVMITRW